MNRLSPSVRATALRCLTEGMSVRATSRVAGISKGTVLRLLAEAGEFCVGYHCLRTRNLPTVRAEADEQWSFCGAKQRNASLPGHGDLWVFAAIDADSKLVISYLVGARNTENTYAFMEDLAGRVKGRIQLTTDGWAAYVGAVRYAFGFGRCDFAQLVKEYAAPMDLDSRRRYSPPMCTGTLKIRRIGRPEMDNVSTSYVENLNLNTRQHCKRFARLTIAHSRKAENHAHAVALNFFAHNYIRVHSTLTSERKAKTTPAMAAGLTDRPWTVDDLLTLMDPKSVTVK
ncbi:MAG: IS1 family transposase [Gemmatimonadales bacterium]